MTRVAFENNGGGLNLVEYDNNNNMIAIGYGAEFVDGDNNMVDCLLDPNFENWTNFAVIDNCSDFDMQLSDFDNPENEETTQLIGEMINDKIYLYPANCGYAGKKWMGKYYVLDEFNEPAKKIRVQFSYHGCNQKSCQIFDEKGNLLKDFNIN